MPIQPRRPSLRLNSGSKPLHEAARASALRPVTSRQTSSRTSPRSVSASGQGGGGAKLRACIERSSPEGPEHSKCRGRGNRLSVSPPSGGEEDVLLPLLHEERAGLRRRLGETSYRWERLATLALVTFPSLRAARVARLFMHDAEEAGLWPAGAPPLRLAPRDVSARVFAPYGCSPRSSSARSAAGSRSASAR